MEKKNFLGFSEIKQWLRHRHPMILIDQVTNYVPGVSLEALSAISGSLDCINGHFPGCAVYPGTNLIQAFAQSGIILYQLSTSKLRDDEMTLIGAVQARFFGLVVPGDQVRYYLEVDKIIDNTFHFRGKAMVENKRVGAFRGNLVRIEATKLDTKLC